MHSGPGTIMTADLLQGFWTLEFGSSDGLIGAGVINFDRGTAIGGDSQYFYRGSYRLLPPGSFQIELQVEPFTTHSLNVFGTYLPFALILVGVFTGVGHATAQGTASISSATRLGVKLTRRF